VLLQWSLKIVNMVLEFGYENVVGTMVLQDTVKPVFFTCPLFHNLGDIAKISGHEYHLMLF